jgi:hypothetical protein
VKPEEAKETALDLAAEMVVGLGRQRYAEEALIDATDEELDQVSAAFIAIGVELYRRAGIRCCRVCGCSEDNACDGGCTWVAEDLCSAHPEESRITVVSR